MANKVEDLNEGTKVAIRRVVPFVVLLYILSYLDRVNVGFALQGLQRDIGLTYAQFAFGLSIFFVGYAFLETPSNLIMHRVGARIWLARIMITWGMITTATAFINSVTSFYVLRSLLGIAEAGFFPGVLLYFTFWFTDHVRARVLGRLWLGQCLALVIGGPLSGALLDLDGFAGLRGWQYMFLIEGILTVLVGIWTLWFLTDRPANAAWLTPGQRLAIEEELARERRVNVVLESSIPAYRLLVDVRVLYCSAIFFISGVTLYGITFFLPAQIAQLLGRQIGFISGIVSAVPWICAFIACAIMTRWSDRRQERQYTLTACIAVAVLGISLAGGAAGPMVSFLGLCLAAAGIVAAQPIFFTLPVSFLSGRNAAAGLGIIASSGSLGAFVAPNLRVWAEQFFGSPAAGLYMIGAVAALNVVLVLCLRLVLVPAASMPVADLAPSPGS